MSYHVTQPTLGFNEALDAETILKMLKQSPYVHKGKRKTRLTNVLLLEKANAKYVIALPDLETESPSYDVYAQLKKIVVTHDALIVGDVISGLSLMIGEYGGLKNAIIKYNHISKDIGNHSLFGRILSLVVLNTGREVTF